MKKLLVTLLTLTALTGYIAPAQAIENGDDATGSGFVVPIKTDQGNGKYSGCSGALIAPLIVVTAGHCVFDANGLLTKNVYVGIAGSSASSIALADKILTIQITSTFKNTPTVSDDDLAFLTLGKPQTISTPLVLASEKKISEFKSATVSLKTFGYGSYGNTSTEVVTTPKSMEGTFSNINSIFTNSANIVSTKANACKGDSGSPVLNITDTQVTLVGIITAVKGSINCSQKSTDGTYLTLFTLIGRYANLVFAAATDVMNSQEQLLSSQKTQLSGKDSQLGQITTDLTDTRNELSSVQTTLANTTLNKEEIQIQLNTANATNKEIQTQLDTANATIEALKKKLPQTIMCIKGKLTQKVTAVMPKCPKGFVFKL
jgi:V8-like Glu-specific endopeptidase